jgi:hypothetical protein
VFMAASITLGLCLFGVLGPTSATMGPGFLRGLARLFQQHCFSINILYNLARIVDQSACNCLAETKVRG